MQTIIARFPAVARLLLGLVFFVFGLNGFLHFIPMPPPAGASGALLVAFVESGYLLPLIKGTEVAVGALLLANRFVPLALTVLAPVMVNIVLFHAVLDGPQTLAMPVVLLGLHLYLAWSYRGAFAPMLQAQVRPNEAAAAPARASLARA